MSFKNELISNLDKLHTTEMGAERIRRNLGAAAPDIVLLCKNIISDPRCRITRQGKNYYAKMDSAVITVNAHSFTIITAHKQKTD